MPQEVQYSILTPLLTALQASILGVLAAWLPCKAAVLSHASIAVSCEAEPEAERRIALCAVWQLILQKCRYLSVPWQTLVAFRRLFSTSRKDLGHQIVPPVQVLAVLPAA